MDYLRSLGSAAASSILHKSGLTLPFSLGERIGDLGIWTLHDATRREDGSPATVFTFDASQHRNALPLAKNAVRKLRTLRHPDVLKFLDAVETDSNIYIVTERVRPLAKAMSNWATKSDKERQEWLVWGLHRISVALAFINESAASTHGAIRVDSVLISPSGEWKLGGFELLSNPKDDAAVLYNMGSLLPDANVYCSPEVRKASYTVLKDHDPAVADAYALGILINSVFNPTFPVPPTTQPPHPQIPANARGSIPAPIFAHYKRLLNPSPKVRLTPKGFLELGMDEATGFFARNPLVRVCDGLDNFAVASDADKNELVRTLRESMNSFPQEFNAHRVLPSLVSALEFGGANAAALLPLVLAIGKLEPPESKDARWLAAVVKLFASADRGTRMALLEHMPEYADRLDQRTVAEKIWPHLQTGFADTVAVIREATVRSVILISAKLGDRILNNDLLRHLAKAQLDPEPSIRTNTCILLGRLAPTLGYNTKRKVLVPAFARATKDQFVHARVAGVKAFAAAVDAGCFDIEAVAERVLPAVAACLVDKEKLVRDEAFTAVAAFIKRLEAHAATMPETVLQPEGAPAVGATAYSSGPSTTSEALVNSATGAAGALAGWAISSLGKKLAAGDLVSAMETASALVASPPLDRPMSAPPPPASSSSGSGLNGSVSAVKPPLASPALSTVSAFAGNGAPRPSKAKGLQLGASKKPAASLAAQIAAAEDDDPVDDGAIEDAWGGDLMDVQADQDDWSECHSRAALFPRS
ncbi:ARM repeat-containing protein [Auricularia subglabra TFB-10046 SS5]|uniref:ARM repeat-containing protein n=1 Tax=Auricularia subglabra (strain TFB-10046 / SS5) TaxID=717982 RepID=J0LHG1_AURST|nr:ARM repeat-containing protein [Auricularia subglabra TFB-10046 SS5]